MFTMQERLGELKGKRIAIIGDILHSRVARSNIWGLLKMGAKITLCGPSTLMPIGIENLGVDITYDLNDVLEKSDVLMLLRIQLERQHDKFLPSLREYAIRYGITSEKLKRAKNDVLIMHPGPTNRGLELSAEVADGARSVILDQVTNGVAIRMAILYLLLASKDASKQKMEKETSRVGSRSAPA
jgi:aspartate carbamoyltransferase catalytic subunit